MLKGLKRLAGGGLLLMELRGLRAELAGLRVAGERLAAAFEASNARQWPQQVQPDPRVPAVEVAYVSDDQQAELMDIEMRLTAARGMPPTEDEILLEYDRRHQADTVVAEADR